MKSSVMSVAPACHCRPCLMLVAVPKVKSSQFVPGIRRAMRNAPYRLLMYAATIGTLSHAVTNVIVTYYVACVIRVDGPEEFLGTVLCTFFIPAALSIPVWHFLARITDTRRAWLIGWASHVPICAAAFTLGPGQVKPFLVITGCMGVSYGGSFLSKAMISDAIDYQEVSWPVPLAVTVLICFEVSYEPGHVLKGSS